MLDKNSPFLRAVDPRRPDTLADLAWRGLREAIIGCDLPPDAVVTEAELSERFAYGLAATRSALARLSARGWIAAEPRRGWRVMPISGAHLADLCRARDLLEPALAGAVVSASMAQEIAVLAEVHHAQARSSDGRARRDLIHLEMRLHLTLARAIPEARVRGWLEETWQLSARADICFAGWLDLRVPVPDLRALADAVTAGDSASLAQVLAAARSAFAGRCSAACARSDAPLVAFREQTGPGQSGQSGSPSGDHSRAGPTPTEEMNDDLQS